MTDLEHKLAMATQLLEQAKEAARNPEDEQQKSKLADRVLMVAMTTTTDLMRKYSGLDGRVGALETGLEDAVSKEDVEEMLERQAAETQKAQVNPALQTCRRRRCRSGRCPVDQRPQPNLAFSGLCVSGQQATAASHPA